ncbi:U-box domain-containing protein 45-like [Bidens hawaiensis]|uniref:U-box domain-containing protein 45-like n=1 Tax=Bidens hawaiensis TaxID=980011 RepID=UPI00404B317F
MDTHLHLLLRLIQDPSSQIEAAQHIRRLTKTSNRWRRHFSPAITPLVSMLCSHSPQAHEAALLALLNLAVKDETNKISIVEAGGLEPIVRFLQSVDPNMQEYAVAAIVTLSASPVKKLAVGASGCIPFLLEILNHGSSQAKLESIVALSNLSTEPNNLTLLLQSNPVPCLVNILKTSKKSSKITERCISVLESLVEFEDVRVLLTLEEGGVLAVVEVLESGSHQSREHAVGTLLTMCQMDRCIYREPILKEGVIPGLLELTVHGTPKSRAKAHTLLRLLRESPYERPEFVSETLENILSNIISQIDGEEQCGNAKKMMAEMVQVSMEQSLRHLQQRALVCTPSDIPLTGSCVSEVSLK